jgi:hypothetical protein
VRRARGREERDAQVGGGDRTDTVGDLERDVVTPVTGVRMVGVRLGGERAPVPEAPDVGERCNTSRDLGLELDIDRTPPQPLGEETVPSEAMATNVACIARRGGPVTAGAVAPEGLAASLERRTQSATTANSVTTPTPRPHPARTDSTAAWPQYPTVPGYERPVASVALGGSGPRLSPGAGVRIARRTRER